MKRRNVAGNVAILSRSQIGDSIRGELDLKKWPLLSLATAVVVIGCAGNGGSTSTTGTTGTTGVTGTTGTTGTGRDAVTINLPDTPPLIQTWFLPGEGRNPGDLSAQLDVVRYRDEDGGEAESELATPMVINFTEANPNSREINAIFPASLPSRTYTELELTLPEFYQEDDGGNRVQVGSNISLFLTGLNVTGLRGRTAAVQLFMAPSMFTVGTSVVFNYDQFYAQNRNPISNKINSFNSDYISFDITQVANKPQMPADVQFPSQNATAQRVYASGDGFSISDRDPRTVNGSNGVFVFLTPSSYVEGFFRPLDATTQLKTWELKQADPNVVPLPGENPRLITALKGIYRNHTEVLGNLKGFNMVTIPGSGDGNTQQVVAFAGNGAQVTNMWFGTVDYTAGANPVFRIYPIQNLYPASTAGEIVGTMPRGKLVGADGRPVSISGEWWKRVAGGDFQFNGAAPAGATATGPFTVFRR